MRLLMVRLSSFLVLMSAVSYAGEVEVPLGSRTPLSPGRVIKQVDVRDPSLLQVVTTDGAVSLEGKKNGTTGVTVHYVTGEMERMLVIVGDAQNSKGPRMEHTQVVDLKQNAAAQAKAAVKPPPTREQKQRAALRDASDVVRAAVEAL